MRSQFIDTGRRRDAYQLQEEQQSLRHVGY
jgi:hypothetical protein